jgi:hypothetical protein
MYLMTEQCWTDYKVARHGYSSCKLLNCVATQWEKPLATKINDKEYDNANYYKL